MAFCPEHPKRDQNPKFTPLSETTSIRTLLYAESLPWGFLLSIIFQTQTLCLLYPTWIKLLENHTLSLQHLPIQPIYGSTPRAKFPLLMPLQQLFLQSTIPNCTCFFQGLHLEVIKCDRFFATLHLLRPLLAVINKQWKYGNFDKWPYFFCPLSPFPFPLVFFLVLFISPFTYETAGNLTDQIVKAKHIVQQNKQTRLSLKIHSILTQPASQPAPNCKL